MIKERKLPSYYQFKINLLNGYVRFTDLEGNDLPDYKTKLTKSQWNKTSKYLDRKLIPFAGYSYSIKSDEVKKLGIIIIK